jgi:hypothetical protein
MSNLYKSFEIIVLERVNFIERGQVNNINFQNFGLSQEQVKRFWRRMRKKYSLPRAKRIEQAIISF